MTSPFTITPTPPTSLKLEVGKEGTFSFTVTSLEAPDQSQEVILQALLIGPDEKGKEVDWLVPGPQRALTVAGGKTETVTIAVRTTPTTPLGEHTIKLSIADKGHPNDKFAYSSPVTCEVTGKPVVATTPSSFPKWLIPVIAGGVVVLGLGIFLIVKLVGGGGDDEKGLGKPCDGTAASCANGLLCAPDVLKCLLPGGAKCEDAAACASGDCPGPRKVCAVPLGLACNPDDKDKVPCVKQSACNATQKLCLAAVGAPCKTGAQCETGKCDANNLCALDTPAVKAGDPCETTCPPPLQCSTTKHCVEQVGRPCTAHAQCITDLCEGGTCTEPQPRTCPPDNHCGRDQQCLTIQQNIKKCVWNPGHACTANGDCTSNWCNGGACSRDDGGCDKQADCPSPYLCILAKKRCLLANGEQCGQDADCDSRFCRQTRCFASPCNPPCGALTHCNNDLTRPLCVSDRLIIKTTILKPTFSRVPIIQ